jgi:glucosamine kinase
MGYMIGVDGGATGTIAILADEEGHILHSAQASASNYIAVGQDEARAALHRAVTEAVQGAGKLLSDCTVAVFGLAGLNHPSDGEVYRSLIEPIGLGGELYIENDMVVAWAAATACKPGVIIIAGTGSSAFGVNAAGKRVKTLGWDYVLADQGSGYWIGLLGLRAAIKAWDGRLDNTPLLQAMVDHYHLQGPEDMLKLAYTPHFGKPEIAQFAKEVSVCAEQGDPVAQDILRQAGHELAQAVCAVIKRLGMVDETFRVGLVGGAFRAKSYLYQTFAEDVLRLAPKAIIEVTHYPAVIGAVIYAHFMNGSLSDSVLARLEETSAVALRWKT